MLGAPRRVLGLIPYSLQKLSPRQLHHHDVNNGGGGNSEKEESFRFYKSRGQHILVNPRILDTIVRRSAINPTDTVLEIGPGTGNLTLKLLEAAHRVVAVEIDDRMVHVLEKRVLQHGLRHKLNVIQKDALRIRFPHFDLVVANIPYGISSPLLMKLVYGASPFRSATLLLQKEFAGRLLANPGDSEFNRLAVNVKLVADVEFVMDVSKRDFLPCPKVDSSVVIIRPKDQVPDVDMREWRAFTRTCFSRKNKTLGATFKQKSKLLSLSKLSNVSGFAEEEEEDDHDHDEGGSQRSFKEKIIGVLKTGGYEDKRPSKLSIEELLHLLSLFNGAGIYFHDCRKNSNEDRFDEDDG
ncbi:ribosomal RNA small subunit methyltransferase, mitochondrial [Arachis stenosperma]|uniref:ribosomal RNA small subunit methyltransferase, mitochondrial n=1 Tax=Arachis stenosperma TaxID=217475 RepID=UPI0025AD2BC5|nr:ribosomal RNA small subunit methyltransferase, mitochondrial [Arachis stenosperma]